MAAAAKLKVFRTAIGFHDAYVAAPSKKAALAAWGSDKDLFARGAAELVIDEALTAEPLAAPGKVIKRLRGTVAEQLAALPPDPPKRGGNKAAQPQAIRSPPPARRAPPPPKPSRSALDAAERAVADAETRQAEEDADLRRREQALARERDALTKRHARERDEVTAERSDAETRYDLAMAAWRVAGEAG